MKKNLRFMFTALLMMFGMTAMAQEVTLDFTTNEEWGLPTEYVTEAASYTNANKYTITINASNGHKFNEKDQYLIWGKQGATFTFSAFDFPVERIDVTGREGASGNTLQNIYVGEEAVSTETKGATGKNSYVIADAYQAAGNIYVLKINSNHNSQITKIEIFKKGEAGVIAPTFTPNGGDFEEKVDVTISAGEGATIFYALGEADFKAYTAPFTLTETTTVKAYAEKNGMQSETVTATFTKKEAQQIQKITVAKALEIIAGLEDGAKTTEEYDVEGYVVAVDEWSPKPDGYGNATFDISDEAGNTTSVLKVFRAKNAEGQNFTTDDTPLAVGEKVTVRGQLQKYVKNGVTTPEVATNGKVIARSTLTAINTVKATYEQGVVYNLQGQQVMQPTKGLYIINGKKILLK